jgi:hypothetical protein
MAVLLGLVGPLQSYWLLEAAGEFWDASFAAASSCALVIEITSPR